MNKFQSLLVALFCFVTLGAYAWPPDFSGTTLDDPQRLVEVIIPRAGHAVQTEYGDTGAVANNTAVTTDTLVTISVSAGAQPVYPRELIIIQNDADSDTGLIVTYVVTVLGRAGSAGPNIKYTIRLRGTATYALPVPVTRIVSITYQASTFESSDAFDIGYRGFWPSSFYPSSTTGLTQLAAQFIGELGASGNLAYSANAAAFPQDGVYQPPKADVAADDSIHAIFYAASPPLVPNLQLKTASGTILRTYSNF